MSSIARFIEVFALGTWVGGIVFLSFVVAPGAFRVLASRDQAGAIVGHSLWWLHMIGVVAGIVLLVARVLRTRSLTGMVSPVVLCVLLMIGLTVVSQHAVSPRMEELRGRMGSIEATAEGSPLLAEFGKLHRASVMLESGVLLFGVAGTWFMAGKS
jgi:uncharacterized membrane protein